MNVPNSNVERRVRAVLCSNLPNMLNEKVRHELLKYCVDVQETVFVDRVGKFDVSKFDIIIVLKDKIAGSQMRELRYIARKNNSVYAEISENHRSMWNAALHSALQRVQRRWEQEAPAAPGLRVVKAPTYEPETLRDSEPSVPKMDPTDAYNWVQQWEAETVRLGVIINGLQDQLTERDSLCGTLEKQCEKLSDECAEANARCTSLDGVVDSQKKTISDYTKTVHEQASRIQGNQAALLKARDALDMARDERVQLVAKIADLEKSPRQQDAGIKSHLTQSKKEIEQLQKEKKELAKINEELITRLGESSVPSFNETRANALRTLYELGDMSADDVLKKLWSK